MAQLVKKQGFLFLRVAITPDVGIYSNDFLNAGLHRSGVAQRTILRALAAVIFYDQVVYYKCITTLGGFLQKAGNQWSKFSWYIIDGNKIVFVALGATQKEQKRIQQENFFDHGVTCAST